MLCVGKQKKISSALNVFLGFSSLFLFIWVIVGVVWTGKSHDCGKLKLVTIVDSIVILSTVGLIVCGCFSYLIIQKKKPMQTEKVTHDRLIVTDSNSDSDSTNNSNNILVSNSDSDQTSSSFGNSSSN
ncbi:hypothetical protein M0812_08510 [Anaeramoeba flamelloides]|uniref:Transmembrane protein n=1 Tax=Anaeramoeba flamelloides TaxID=1746091 RepID=A0AAV8A1I3_9EUKA|nr:hypothetical protein M0812_08510 [Anaeramoeba flamelloides]